MRREISLKGDAVEKLFIWTEEQQCYSCGICKKLLRSVKTNNMLANVTEHLKRQHPISGSKQEMAKTNWFENISLVNGLKNVVLTGHHW